ncbi:MAG: GNAT family N-acetyltransferase [Leptolyngbya sp. BL-A-14]
MTQVLPQTTQIVIRSIQYRDLETVECLCEAEAERDRERCSINEKPAKALLFRPWHGLKKALSLVWTPSQQTFGAYLAEQDNQLRGMIRISPFNRTRSTWRVDRVAVVDSLQQAGETPPEAASEQSKTPSKLSLATVGSQLLRHCFEKIWEARTWLLEVDVNDTALLALYRQNGFQPLAQMTYWVLAPEQLQEIAEREPDLPNLLPISNADAQLLYQLDTAAMPPLVRQVFDRHVLDFKTSLLGSLMGGVKNWFAHAEVVSGYVFEPQRKAAIGYFQIRLCRDGSQPHQAQLTVHPAYTWLYPELMSQMARITQEVPPQSLELASSDYQPEREEYLERVGASRLAHTLMMSRSVWHKLRESKLPMALDSLQLSEVLQGFKPARKPVPGRISLLRTWNQSTTDPKADVNTPPRQASSTDDPTRSNPLLNLPTPTEFSDPPQEGPCC